MNNIITYEERRKNFFREEYRKAIVRLHRKELQCKKVRGNERYTQLEHELLSDLGEKAQFLRDIVDMLDGYRSPIQNVDTYGVSVDLSKVDSLW